MSGIVELVELHAATALAGATVLLVVGALGGLAARGAIHRQRIGELTVLGVLVWLVLACVPLHRPGMEWLRAVEVKVFGGRGVGSNGAVVERRVADRGVLGDATGPPEVDAATEEAWLAVAAALGESVAGEAWDGPIQVGEERAWLGSSEGRALGFAESDRAGAGARAIDWARCAATVYLVGAGVAVLWLQVGWVLVWRLVRLRAPPRAWLEELYRALPFAGGRRRPRLVVSRRCRQAFSWGIWRPTVVLPAEGCRPGRREQVRHVLLHELGHAAQRDAWGNFVLNVALPVLYVHPLYWWLRRQVRVARELIADDWAARRSTKEAYAEELLGLVKARGRFGLSYLSVMGMSARRSQFYRRMEMLLQREGPLSTRCSGAWRGLMVPVWVLVVGVMVAAVGVERSVAQEGESEAQVEQREEVARESEEDERESAEEKELKESLAKLREEREALRAELDELRKRMVEFQAKLQSVEKEEDLTAKRREAEAKRSAALQEEDEAKYRVDAKKRAEEARERAVNAARLQQFKNAYRAFGVEEWAEAAAARERAEAERAIRYQELQRQNGEKQPRAVEGFRRSRERPGGEEGERNEYFQRAFEAQTQVGAALGQGSRGSQSDLDALIRLATQYVTAQSEIPAPESRLAKMKAANKLVPNTFPPDEIDAAAIALETAQRKVELFRKIAQVVSDAAKTELSLASRAVQDGDLSDAERLAARSQMAQAEAKLKILRLVLE